MTLTVESSQLSDLTCYFSLVTWDPAFAEKLLNFIISEVIRHHEQIAEETLTSGGALDS